MSETPVVPAPMGATPSAEGRRMSLPQSLLFLLLAGAGLIAILVIATATYGIAREYGSPSVPWLGIAAWALVPAACWTAALAVVRRALGPRVWSPWLVGLFVLVLTTLLAAGLTVAAAAAHDTDAAARAAACSPADVAVLTGVPGWTEDLGAPTGQDDGSCVIRLSPQGDAYSAVASVAKALEAAGWTTTSPSPEGIVLATRDTAALVVRAGESDGKGTTDVVVAVLPD